MHWLCLRRAGSVNVVPTKPIKASWRKEPECVTLVGGDVDSLLNNLTVPNHKQERKNICCFFSFLFMPGDHIREWWQTKLSITKQSGAKKKQNKPQKIHCNRLETTQRTLNYHFVTCCSSIFFTSRFICVAINRRAAVLAGCLTHSIKGSG